MTEINTSIDFHFNNDLLQSVLNKSSSSLEKTLFFDIETTGFSPNRTILYLIGCIYYKDNSWQLKQLFLDEPKDEKEFLSSFLNFVKDFTLLIHYNGNGFDIPYLEKKCFHYNLESNFTEYKHLDLYRQIQPFKKMLRLEQLKQKSIEQFLGISRSDLFNGGELINVYYEYLKTKDKRLEKVLLLHNSDDIKGMLALMPMLSYSDFFTHHFTITSVKKHKYTDLDRMDKQELLVEMEVKNPFPEMFSYGWGPIYIIGNKNKVKLRIQLYTGEMKFFYSNYKDYYYLPEEDLAIHKSIAFYVDKNFRTRAKATNCYSKKTACFLPQYEEIISPCFKIDYYDKSMFFEASDELLKNNEKLTLYLNHILNTFIKPPKI
ncbi:MAG: ribonuclease H-like domain-containing protein [Clostridiales bacterium]|nr:ribonuclease H-like domain-containing protein [Clostridiales bacterium]